MYVNIPVEIWQVVRDDLDDRHPLLREIEALEARNRASMREINRVLDAATSSHGTWAVQWPKELEGNEEGWAGNGGAREFAARFIQYVLDDTLMPHAKDRLLARQRQRVSARIEGRAESANDTEEPAATAEKEWMFMKRHREQKELEALRYAVMASFQQQPEVEVIQRPEDIEPAMFSRAHKPHGIVTGRKSKSSTAVNTGDTGGGTAVCGKQVMATGSHFADFYLKHGSSGISVGVARPSFDVHVDLGLASRFASASPQGWCFCANSGIVRHNGEASLWAGMEGAKQGDHIGLLLNFDMGTLTVFKSESSSDHYWRRLGVLESALSGELCWMVELRKTGDAVKITAAPAPIVRISQNQSELEQMIAVALESGMDTTKLEEMLFAEKQLQQTDGTTAADLALQQDPAVRSRDSLQAVDSQRRQLDELERMVAEANATNPTHEQTLALSARMNNETSAKIMRAEHQRRAGSDSDEEEEQKEESDDTGNGRNTHPGSYFDINFEALPLAIRKAALKLQFTAESWPHLPHHADTAIFYDDLEEDERDLAAKLGCSDATSWYHAWDEQDRALGDAEALYAEGWTAIAAHKYEAAIKAFEAGLEMAKLAEDQELEMEMEEGLEAGRQNLANRDVAHHVWIDAKAKTTAVYAAFGQEQQQQQQQQQQVARTSAEYKRQNAALVAAKQAEGEAAIAAHQYDSAVSAFEEAVIVAGEIEGGAPTYANLVMALQQHLEIAKAGREARSRALVAWDTAKSTFDAASAAAYVRGLRAQRLAQHATKKAKALLASGQASAAASDYRAAIDFFNAALTEHTSDSELTLQLNKALAAAKWNIETVRRAEEVARSQLAVGKLRLAENNVEMAIEAFEKALREKPENQELLNELNECLERATARHLNEQNEFEKKMRKQFSKHDSDNSGYLSEQELLEAIHTNVDGNLTIAGLDSTSDEFHSKVAEVIEAADKDKDGKINYDEFLAIVGMLEARNHLSKKPEDEGLSRDLLAITKIQAHIRGFLACSLAIEGDKVKAVQEQPRNIRRQKLGEGGEEHPAEFRKQQREMEALMDKLHVPSTTKTIVEDDARGELGGGMGLKQNEEKTAVGSPPKQQQQQRAFVVSAVVAKLLLTRQKLDEESRVPIVKRPIILLKPWLELSAPLKAAAALLKFGDESWPRLPLDSPSAVPYALLNAHEKKVAAKLGLVGYWEELLKESGVVCDIAGGDAAPVISDVSAETGNAADDLAAAATPTDVDDGAKNDSGSDEYEYEYETEDEVENEGEEELGELDATPEQKDNARVIAINKYAEGQTALQATEFNWASWAFEAGLATLSEPNIPVDGVFGEWTNKLKDGLLAAEAGLNAMAHSRKQLANLTEGINSDAFQEQLALESPLQAALALTRAKLAEGNTAIAAHEFEVASAAFEAGLACLTEIRRRTDVPGASEEISQSGLKASLYDGLQMTKAAVLARTQAYTSWQQTRDLVMAYEAHLNSDAEHFRILSNLIQQAGLNPQILALHPDSQESDISNNFAEEEEP
eukprot:COSAG05_NODE_59_length_23169_cov_37.393698_14_plen_1520_part_00